MKSSTCIPRRSFLKHSGLIAAGFPFLPHSVLAAITQSSESEEVSITELARYQILVPDQASPVELQAAQKLQHYINEISGKELAAKEGTGLSQRTWLFHWANPICENAGN